MVTIQIATLLNCSQPVTSFIIQNMCYGDGEKCGSQQHDVCHALKATIIFIQHVYMCPTCVGYPLKVVDDGVWLLAQNCVMHIGGESE